MDTFDEEREIIKVESEAEGDRSWDGLMSCRRIWQCGDSKILTQWIDNRGEQESERRRWKKFFKVRGTHQVVTFCLTSNRVR